MRQPAKNRSGIPLPGDVYIKRFAVYKVMVYNETDDTVLFATTNDIIQTFGKMPRLKIRFNDLHICPYQLLGPAVQVFELDEKLNQESLEKLRAYHSQNKRLYDRLGIPDLFQDVDDARTRIYTVPEEQGQQYPDLMGKTFDVPIPFLCITKALYKERYRLLNLSTHEEYHRAMRHAVWPIFYVPSRFS